MVAKDVDNNIIRSELAEYNENTKIFKSFGPTTILTSEKYFIDGKDITADAKNKIIVSKNDTIITDQDKNRYFYKILNIFLMKIFLNQ